MGSPVPEVGEGLQASWVSLPPWLEPLAGLGCWTIELVAGQPLADQPIDCSTHALVLLGQQGRPPATVADLIALCMGDDQPALVTLLQDLVNSSPGRPKGCWCRLVTPSTLPWVRFDGELRIGADHPVLVGILREGSLASATADLSPWQAEALLSPASPGLLSSLERELAQARTKIQAAQRAQDQAQTLFRQAMESAPVGMALCHPETHGLVQVNPSLCAFLARSQAELMASPWQELTHPDDRNADGALAQELLQGRLDSYRMRKRFLQPDGAVVWGDLSVVAIRQADGRACLLLKQIIDITELVQVQAQLKEQRLQLRSTLDSLLDPHLLLDVVRDGRGLVHDFRLADANETALHVLRSTREKLLGASLLTILPGLNSSPLMTLLLDAADRGGYLVLDDMADPTGRLVPSDGYVEVRAIRVNGVLSLTWRDVTERHQMIQRISSSEQQHRLLTENASDVVMLVRQGVIEWISPVLNRMLGWSPGRWIGHRLEQFVHPEDLALARQCCLEDLPGASRVTRLRLRDPRGQHHWVEAHSSAISNEAGRPDGIVASFRTIDQEVASEQALERRARFDDLTGLVNRSEMLERFRLLLTSRPRRVPMAVLFIDIDEFKRINDRYGHAGGDCVLKTVAQRIHQTIRRRDWAARIGGDEMLVVLYGLNDLAKALVIGDKIRAAAQVPIEFGPDQITVTISVGVTLASSEESVDAIIARADHAMYQAKQQGRDQVMAIPAGLP